MVTIAVTYKAKRGMREADLRAARICSGKTRVESGNHDHAFYAGIDDESTFFLFEHWESRKAFDAHLASEHSTAFRAALADLLERPSEIRIFEVSAVKAD